jgi:hypothetical protein
VLLNNIEPRAFVHNMLVIKQRPFRFLRFADHLVLHLLIGQLVCENQTTGFHDDPSEVGDVMTVLVADYTLEQVDRVVLAIDYVFEAEH